MQLTEDLKKHILIVEDEGLLAADMQKKLELLGYPTPAIASSGKEALRCARSTPIDLVLMDIRLKGEMDGITAAAALRAESDTPVIYITAHADPESINRAKLTEPLGYLLKPISTEDLHSTVRISLYRHDMEHRLRTSEAWLSATLRSVGEGIIATNPQGEIVFMNPLAERLTGWHSDSANGQMLMDVLGLFEEAQCVLAINPIFGLHEGESRAYGLISKAGTYTPVEVQCFENRCGHTALGSIVVLRDLSRRREEEHRMTPSQRVEALSRMAGEY